MVYLKKKKLMTNTFLLVFLTMQGSCALCLYKRIQNSNKKVDNIRSERQNEKRREQVKKKRANKEKESKKKGGKRENKLSS